MRAIAKFALLTALAAALAKGQAELTLRTGTRLVQISVIAQDRKGCPVLDLKREDFQLFDNNKPREVQVFNLDRVEPSPASTTASPAGNTFTNTTGDRSAAAGITVIVLDSLNTKWTDQSQAAVQIIRFLRQIQPGDRIAIYSLEYSGFRVLHDFTRDASDLVQRLSVWNGEIAPKSDMSNALASVLSGEDPIHRWKELAGDAQTHDTPKTLRALKLIAQRLEGIPGRKNVIWISDGFPVVEWGNLSVSAAPGPHDPRGPEVAPILAERYGMARDSGGKAHDTIGSSSSHYREFLAAMKYISQANVAIYPIDIQGLLGGTASESAHLYQDSTQQAMLEIAKKTGGRAFINDNDVSRAISKSVEDSRVTYTLGFYPDSDHIDGKFHTIAIRIPRRRDVTLRYQMGYLNEAFAASDLARRKRDLEQAFWSPLDANAIPLKAEVSWLPFGRALLNLNIDAPRLALIQGPNLRYKDEVDILILQRDETGNVFGRINETIQMELREASYRELLLSGVLYRREIEIEPNATVIRLVVRDSGTGNMGSLTVPVAVHVQ